MSNPEQYHESKYNSKLKRNPSAVSQYTAASGIADSTISYGESLRLSQFPPPPSSIPATPISQTAFAGGASAFTTATTIPLVPLRRVPHEPAGAGASTSPAPDTRWELESSSHTSMYGTRKAASNAVSPSASRTLSPYDWHEGASSIDVDAAEDRLLPTSFITSLLQESSTSRKERRVSIGSDAISGISEMTYPPLLSYAEATRNDSTPSHYLSNRHGRPAGARPPPSSFAPIPEHERSLSGDSETVYDQESSIIRTASVTRNAQVPGSSIVGVAPAKLHNVSPGSRYSSRQENICDKEDSFSRTTENDSISHYKELHKVAPYMMPLENEPPIWLASSQGPRILQPVRSSVYSAKSTAPSIFSRISSNKSVRRALTWRRKPLPPVPIIPHISIATEMEHRREDEVAPLPDLVNRAGALHGLLEKGHHPHHSITSQYPSHVQQLSSGFDDADTMAAARSIGTDSSPKAYQHPIEVQKRRSACTVWITSCWQQHRRWFVLVVFLILAILGGVVAVAAVFANRGQHRQAICSNGFVGANCNLNATCACTVPSSACNPLAQNIVDLVPSLNKLFLGNETGATVYNAVWATLGAQTGNNCASQSLLVDTGSALNPGLFPNRTTWAQTALLWNLFKSQDEDVASQLQLFVTRLSWHELDGSDGPVLTTQSSFTTSARGYEFNFAAQTVSPVSASFIHDGQPLSAQISRVGSDAQSTLDQMYSYAVASSQQTELALTKYWTSVLKQDSKDLSTFKSALSVSPVLLPFDGSFSLVRDLYINSTPGSFPPPLACYPNLGSEQISQIDSIETAVFGLHPISNFTQFDIGCYPTRPVYGVIDMLRLRLPFSNSRHGVSKQAVILSKDALPRVIVSAGEALSALPGSDDEVALSISRLDPRNSGTFGNINHVLLQYFSSIPRTDIATALVEFVLNAVTLATPVPPASSLLFESIDLIPALEVAVFGTIAPSDISGVYSSFTAPNGALYFGSGDGAAMRNWTIAKVQQDIVWTENATSPVVVHDLSFSDSVFEQAWNASATAIAHSLTNVGVLNITTSFSTTGKLTP